MRPALALLLCLASTAGAATPPLRDPIAERIAALGAALAEERRSPRAGAILAELQTLVDEAPNLARLATIFSRVADDAAALPEVRALARLQLSELERARGNLQRSHAMARRLGFVTEWRAIGPLRRRGEARLRRPPAAGARAGAGGGLPGEGGRRLVARRPAGGGGRRLRRPRRAPCAARRGPASTRSPSSTRRATSGPPSGSARAARRASSSTARSRSRTAATTRRARTSAARRSACGAA